MARRRGGGLSPETSGFIIKLGLVFLTLFILYIFILRHPKFLDWLRKITTGGGSFPGAVAGQTNFHICEGPADSTKWCTAHPCLS